jgi:hypothetical protein
MANGDGIMAAPQPCAISHQPLAMTFSTPPVDTLVSQSTIQSAIRNPQSAIRNPQSAM